MVEGNQYIETVKLYFCFLTIEFDFKVKEEKIRGNAFYDVQYTNQSKIVSISYENIEDYLLVIVFLLQNGRLPNYDDKTKTLHLHQLNMRILSSISKTEIDVNDEYFSKFLARDGLEKKLLKSAKELRLCLNNFDKIYA